MSTTDVSQATTDPRYQMSGKAARPEPIIDAIQSVQQVGDDPPPQHEDDFFGTDGAYLDEAGSTGRVDPKAGYLPEMALPGFGEKREWCGDPLPHFCEDCAAHKVIGRTCNRSTCPRCGAAWCLHTADGRGRDGPGHVTGLEALRKKLFAETPEWYWPKFHHLFISPDWGWRPAADDPVEKTVEVIKQIMDELGIQGHIYGHPYRGVDAEREEDDRGEWPKRLFADRDWQDDVRDELEVSWHFHIVGVADYVKGGHLTDRVEDETGWVIRRITRDDAALEFKSQATSRQSDSVSVWGLDALARVVMYCLSHTGLYQTEAGNWRAMTRQRGDDLNGIRVFDRTREQAEMACRKAAPKILDIAPATLACDAKVPTDADDCDDCPGCEDCDDGPDRGLDAVTAHAIASTVSPVSPVSPGGPGSAGSPGAVDADFGFSVAEGGGVSYDRTPSYASPDRLDSDDDRETCNGTLLNLGKAPRYLANDEWAENAPYADNLRDVLEQWTQTEEWIG